MAAPKVLNCCPVHNPLESIVMHTKNTNQAIFDRYFALTITTLFEQFPLAISADDFARFVEEVPVPSIPPLADITFNKRLVKLSKESWEGYPYDARRVMSRTFAEASANVVSRERKRPQSLAKASEPSGINDAASLYLGLVGEFEEMLLKADFLAGHDISYDQYANGIDELQTMIHQIVENLEKLYPAACDQANNRTECNALEEKIAGATVQFLLDVGLILRDDERNVRLSGTGYQFCFQQAPTDMRDKVFHPSTPSDTKSTRFQGGFLNIDLLHAIKDNSVHISGLAIGTALVQAAALFLGFAH